MRSNAELQPVVHPEVAILILEPALEAIQVIPVEKRSFGYDSPTSDLRLTEAARQMTNGSD